MALPPKVSLILLAACSAAILPQVAAAQNITVDGRFSPAQTLVGPNYAITANLGKQVGSNLFHSFGQFGLATGEGAAFSGPATVNNIIGRVTGGNPSSIDGRIQSNIAGANLYLINPTGIVFGPHATVNVSGSFHASTADYIKMSNGAKFQATNPDASTLSAAPPVAFGFLTAKPAAIAVNGSTLGPVPGTLGVVAGPVSITGGATLSAPAGAIHVTSAAGTGEVPVDPRNTAALTVTSFGPVDIKGNSTLDVSDPKNFGSGGSVFIRAGALTIDASEINGDNFGSGAGSTLSLRGDNQITLSNRANLHAIAMSSGSGANVSLSTASSGGISVDASIVRTAASGSGDGGSLSLETSRLALANGAGLTSSTQGSGNGGPIQISANSVLVDGASTSIASMTTGAGLTGPSGNPIPAGAGGKISITAGSLTIQGGASIASTSAGDGPGGGVALNISELAILNLGSITSQADANGDGGPITISASSVVLNGVGAPDPSTGIFSATNSAPGRGGSISIIAGELALHNGVNVLASSCATRSCDGSNPTAVSGLGGELTVSVGGSVIMDTGASLGTMADATGTAGNVSVATAGPLTIDMSVGASRSIFQGIGSQTLGTGTAGSVTVSGGTIAIIDSGEIQSVTGSSGNAGNVTVTASDRLTVDGTGANPAAAPTGIFSQAVEGKGAAGTVNVTAGRLSIINNGEISSSTFGEGNAGNLTVAVSGQIMIDGSGGNPEAHSVTGMFSQANPGSGGDAGNVSVSAGTLSIVNNGFISVTTFTSRSAGNIMVSVADQLVIDGAGENIELGPTGVFSRADLGSSGAAGNVRVGAGNLLISNNGVISSETLGSGNGGNVTVAARNLSITSGGRISTDTIGTGSGKAGEISVAVADRLTLDGVLRTSSARISSSSEMGSDGTAGDIQVLSGTLSIGNGGAISTTTSGSGAGGTIAVAIDNEIALTSGGLITSATSGAGNAGAVEVVAQGPLNLVGSGSGIIASATSTASGNAGTVTVSAPQITIRGGSEIASTTAGTGAGGSVIVVASDIVLRDPGPQITAVSTGSGDAGSITVRATRLLMSNGAEISTEAVGERSVASGGDITLQVGDFLYLIGSEISTSVKGETGNGGNITVDPPLVILDHSRIKADAIEGHGGNIKITADPFIQSSDSSVEATSDRGISGTVVVNGLVNANGALVVLSSQLRGRTEVLREACATRNGRPISSLVETGRGGLPQDPEATLPALYIAGRNVNPNPLPGADADPASSPVHTAVHLTMRCG